MKKEIEQTQTVFQTVELCNFNLSSRAVCLGLNIRINLICPLKGEHTGGQFPSKNPNKKQEKEREGNVNIST